MPSSATSTLIDAEVRGPVTNAQREDLHRVNRSAGHLLGLINDVLDFARIEAGRVDIKIVDVPVTEALADIESLLAPLMAAKSQAFSRECEASVTGRADREKLDQILINLVGNAIKYTDENGSIRLTCAADGDMVRVDVHDTGRGIDPADLATIFDPFVRAGRHPVQGNHRGGGGVAGGGGIGLGLSISRELARAMNGDVTAVSTPGAGSTFSLHLPRSTPDHAEKS
jgi:signal transduction histidine kinase